MPFKWELVEDWDPYEEVPWARGILRRLSPRYLLPSQILLETISELVEGEISWLDVGAGGNWLIHHYEEGESGLAIGTDVYLPNELKRRDRFLLARGEKMPFSDEAFDLISAHWVVEHLREPGAFLGEAFRLLRPGGRLFVRTTNLLSPLTALARCLPERFKRAIVDRVFLSGTTDFFETYYRMNVPRSLSRLPRGTGFEVESVRYLEDLHFKNRGVFLAMFLYERLTALRPLRYFRSQVFAVYRKPVGRNSAPNPS
jgi:SAM-dependent methyltransferase